MKFFCIILVFISALNFSISLSQDKQNSERFMEVQMLINSDLDDNYKLIKEKSTELTPTQKMFIYDDKKISAGLPFVLNLLVGYGIGSWVQGHTAGGLIGTVGNIGGMILIFTAENESTAMIGVVLLLGTWLIDCILPFTYSSAYNKKLRYALGITGTVSLDIQPKVNMTHNGNVAPGVTFSASF